MKKITATGTNQTMTLIDLSKQVSQVSIQVEKLHRLVISFIEGEASRVTSPVRNLREASVFLRISDSQTRRLVAAGKLRARRLDPGVKSSRLFFDVQDLLQFHYLRHNRRLTPTEKKEFMNKTTTVLTIVGQTEGRK
jgi:hypothetical protein